MKRKRTAYITSGKVGLHRFTFNELKLLEANSVDFELCLTQLNQGPCMPESNWVYHTARRLNTVLEFVQLLFSKQPVLQLFLEAKRKKVLPYFLMSLSLYRAIKNNGITSIHCQMGDDKLYMGYFLKKLMNIPLSVTIHAHELYMRKVYDKNEEVKELFSHCDKVLTISDFNVKIIVDKFGVDEGKIEVMRLFPDIDIQNVVKNKTKILIVANWVEKKGYKTLLKALKHIERDDFVLWVVGGSVFSDDSIDVQTLIREFKIEDKVAILGRLGTPMLDIVFYACDIFCLPSHTDYYADGNPSEREGIPVALMEAMAWGKPVIATHHAGNSELIEEKLIEEKNVEQLTEELNYLLDHPQEWKSLGERNKEIVEKKYSKSNIEVLANILKRIH